IPPAPIRPTPIRSLAPKTVRANGPPEASMPTVAPARPLLKSRRVISASAIFFLPPISCGERPQRKVPLVAGRHSRALWRDGGKKIEGGTSIFDPAEGAGVGGCNGSGDLLDFSGRNMGAIFVFTPGPD